MIAAPLEEIDHRSRQLAAHLGCGEVVAGESTVGGGSLPGETLPTRLLRLDVPSPIAFLRRLRQASPPVIARTQDERVVLDPRTVLREQDDKMLAILQEAMER
jgi:L-seryl-tRNA(Ser) seleniumtransferase